MPHTRPHTTPRPTLLGNNSNQWRNGKQCRYGFNGFEKDDEVKGVGNSYTTLYRQYDTRLGRWNSLDPLSRKYPGLSNYSYAANSPILLYDNNGDVIRPTNSIAKNVVQTRINEIFKKNFPTIFKHIKYKEIGTHKDENDKVIKVFAFVYVEESEGDNEPKLSYSSARRIIKKSDLSNEEKLIALAYLYALYVEDIVEVQTPYNPEKDQNYTILSSNQMLDDLSGKINKLYKDFNEGKATLEDLNNEIGKAVYGSQHDNYRFFDNEDENNTVKNSEGGYDTKIFGVANMARDYTKQDLDKVIVRQFGSPKIREYTNKRKTEGVVYTLDKNAKITSEQFKK